MKTVQIPRGPSNQEDGVTGPAGQLRADMERGEIRLHDGSLQGGHRIPNIERVKELIATGGDESAAAGSLRVFTSTNGLADEVPASNTLAILIEDGLEDAFIWRPGAAGTTDIASNIDGHWERLNSEVGMAIRLYRMGMFDMQIAGVEPVADQDTTAWLDGALFKTWDGADYITTTPETFARLFAHIGGYTTTSFSLPDSLGETLTELADLDDATNSGWYSSAAAAANSPIAGVHAVEHRKISATSAIQVLQVTGSVTLARYVRYQVASVWSAWVLALDTLPARLEATSSLLAGADSAVESGFYKTNAASSNIPVAEDGTLVVVRYSSTSATQIFQGITSGRAYTRSRLASVWSDWVEINPLRLDAIALNILNANFGADSGFYRVSAAATNIPVAEDGVILALRYASTSGSQTWYGLTSGQVYSRQLLASVWGAWRRHRLGNQIGTVELLLDSAAPDGTLKLNGAAVSRTTYAELFALWGTTYGVGNGTTTFNVKDVRGEFLRFAADGGSVDSGRVLGSNQSEMIGPHTHTASSSSAGSHNHAGSGTTSSNGAHTHTLNIADDFGNFGNTHMPNTSNTTTLGQITTSSSGAHDHTYSFTTDTEAAHSHTITVNNNSGTENRVRNVALLAVVRFE